MTTQNLNPNEIIPPAPTVPDTELPPPPDEGDARIKKDMLKYKDEASSLKKQIEDMKMKGHKEKEDWKAVSEHHEQKAKEYEQKYSGLKEGLIREKKISALMIEAQKQGMMAASLPDLELLDFDDVIVETTSTGKILVTGQDRSIAKLKTLRPHWFTTSVPSVNITTPKVGPANSDIVTMADLNTAESQYKKTRSESDKKNYYEIIQKYKSQHG